MKLKSRQWLAFDFGEQQVAPGGNRAADAADLLPQERNQHLAVDPSADTFFIMLGKMTKSGDGLQAFEYQLDLPSDPVPFQHGLGGELRLIQRGKNNHIAGVFQRRGFGFWSSLCFPLDFALGSARGLFTLAQSTDTSRHHSLWRFNPHRPMANVARRR